MRHLHFPPSSILPSTHLRLCQISSVIMSSTETETKMKALHYDGPFKVAVREIDRPKLQHPDDAIIKVTTACICGSDLHMYQGRTAAQAGLVFGHENMGIVTEVGSGVTLLKKGDRIVLPFNVADGRCRNCEEGKTAFCTGVNPGFAGGAYGYVAMGCVLLVFRSACELC